MLDHQNRLFLKNIISGLGMICNASNLMPPKNASKLMPRIQLVHGNHSSTCIHVAITNEVCSCIVRVVMVTIIRLIFILMTFQLIRTVMKIPFNNDASKNLWRHFFLEALIITTTEIFNFFIFNLITSKSLLDCTVIGLSW